MRVSTVFKRLLRLDDVNVTAVQWHARMIVVTVALRRRAAGMSVVSVQDRCVL